MELVVDVKQDIARTKFNMKATSEQIKELQSMISNSKDHLLIKNWERSIELLNNKKHGRNNQNNDSSFQGKSE